MTTTTDPHLIDDLCQLILGNVDPSRIDEVTWPEIIGLARRHGLGPMLHWTLRQDGLDMGNNPLMTPLVQSVRQTAVRFLLIASTQIKVEAALKEAGIPTIWLKGVDLARSIYPQANLRPMGDIDFLVPFEQRRMALEIVQSMGYQSYRDSNSRSLPMRG